MPSFFRGYRAALMGAAAVALAGGLAPAARAQDSVTINLGSSNSSPDYQGAAGMSQSTAPADGKTTSVNLAGSPAKSTKPPTGQTGGYMYFKVNDKFAKAGSVPDLWVTVEYLDQGNDFFTLEYDAKDYEPAPTDPDLDGDGIPDLPDTDGDGLPGPQDPARTINRPAEFGPDGLPFPTRKTDSGQWRSKTFALTNVWFGNRQDGSCDLRINDMTNAPDATDEGPEVIRKVTVSKVVPIAADIPLTDAPPKIDGVLDDAVWQTAYKREIKEKWQVIHPANQSTWSGPDDYSATVSLAWDATALYGAFDVTDDVPRENIQTAPSSMWNGDAVEFYLGLNQANKGRTSYILGKDFQVVIGVGENPLWGILQGTTGGAWNPEDHGFMTADYVAVKDKPNGFVVEIKLPWGMLPDATGAENVNVAPAPGSELGFNFFADDSDRGDGTSGQDMAMSFSGIPNSWSTPAAWSTVRLIGPSTGLKGDIKKDGAVTVEDAVLGLRIIVGLETGTAEQVQTGDFDASNALEVGDIVKILQIIVGIG